MFKWGIRARIIVSFLILITISLSMLGSYILWYFHQQNLKAISENLLVSAKIAEQLLTDELLNSQRLARIDSTIKELGLQSQFRITVIDPNGTVLADSWESTANMENQIERPEVQAALAAGSGTASRYNTETAQNLLYVAIPINKAGTTIGIIRTASSLSFVETAFNQIRSALLAAVILTALFTVLLSVWLARKYTAPLEHITEEAHKIADGDLERRIHVRTGDELELLAHTINQLTSNLDDKIIETAAEAHKLSLILQHMDNAVVLLDRYCNVTTANRMAREIFNITDPMIGKHNIQVIGNSLLDHAAHETIAKSQSRLIDLKISIHGTKRVFQVFFAPITNDKEAVGVLSVFHDITALQEIHERQVDFVANASHELATPLTAIKGFAETLLDGALTDPGLSVRFVSIIHTEAERMNRLIKELLQLAKLDSQEYRQQIRLEPTPVAPILQTVIEELAPHYKRKKQTVLIEPFTAPVVAKTNHDWLKQVVVNLVENSIKYTPNNGQITLKCWHDGQNAYVMVQDTGIGIPAKDLPLIFDRFYRVDRARARTAGGTGLGLSLVKFIIDMLGGKINVQSQVNFGTTFTVSLPLNTTTEQ